MSKQYLQMKYHPAKKEVEFQRFQSGKEIPIRKDSKLYSYMSKKGQFVLQDHGNTFLADIAQAFDGEQAIDIKVITTKNDYEDFVQMVEYYNESGGVRIDLTFLSELPDMESTYHTVKEHGEKAIAILQKHKSRFFEINLTNPDVKQCVEGFSADVKREIDSITDKIKAMAVNNVNLCFAGVYSAGKSALINAILGYAILPENINSETARMFLIQSPLKGEHVRIEFTIRNSFSEIVWNEQKGVFEFASGPVESASRNNIQKTINQYNGEPRHIQMVEVLRVLNGDRDVSPEVKVYFPIPLDNDNVQFTIYDTPGTDSNYTEHQSVLQDALSEQTHSILIFVAAPNKTEGEGNNALLNYLKAAEQNDSKTSIDIGRSLFVINWADSIGPKQRKELQKAEIKHKGDDSFTIRLWDKKLFFTSAKIAYAAKSTLNGIATEDEEYTVTQHSASISDPKFGRYYQQDRCATSEYMTDRVINSSAEALAEAEAARDTLAVLHICSGLYALENEIVLYGEKYASAVRAFAIIDSVDKALSTLNTRTGALKTRNSEDIQKVNMEILTLKDTITIQIESIYEGKLIPQGQALPQGIVKELHLDKEYISQQLVGEPKGFIDKLLRGHFLGFGEVRAKKEHETAIKDKIASVLSAFSREYEEKRLRVLEGMRDDFIMAAKEVIRKNGQLSDEAKNFVCNIRTPQIGKAQSLSVGDIYNAHKREKTFLMFKREIIDKEGFLEDIEGALMKLTASVNDTLVKDFSESLASVLAAVKAEFSQNIEKYSALMQAKLKDKSAMEHLGEKISDAARELEQCQKELESLIWSVKNNE